MAYHPIFKKRKSDVEKETLLRLVARTSKVEIIPVEIAIDGLLTNGKNRNGWKKPVGPFKVVA